MTARSTIAFFTLSFMVYIFLFYKSTYKPQWDDDIHFFPGIFFLFSCIFCLYLNLFLETTSSDQLTQCYINRIYQIRAILPELRQHIHYLTRPHLVQSSLRDREVNDAQLLIVIGQHIKGTSQVAGVWGQLVPQHVLVALLQLDAGEGRLHVGVDRARVWVGFGVCQMENDGVAVTKPKWWRMERKTLLKV